MLFRSTLNQAQQNYEVYDRELLAIHSALKYWRHYLEGHPTPVLVRCDHHNLNYYKDVQQLSPRQVRMHLYLTRFNLQLEYTPGHKLIIPDVLSRKGNHSKAEPVVVTVIPPEMIIGVVNLDLQQRIRLAYQ